MSLPGATTPASSAKSSGSALAPEAKLTVRKLLYSYCGSFSLIVKVYRTSSGLPPSVAGL